MRPLSFSPELIIGFVLAIGSILSSVGSALGEGDPEKGEQQFVACMVCHTIGAGEPALTKPGSGPNLHGLYGKIAATNHPEFAYSAALKKSGLVWNDETLDAWIKRPAALVPDNNMVFLGIANLEARSNIIAYLKMQSK